MNTLQHRLAEALRDAQKCINSMRIEFRLHGQITDASAHWAIVTEPKVMQALREHDSSASAQGDDSDAKRDAAYYRWKLELVIPLFEEARDALCALTTTQIKLHNIRSDLAKRMDYAGEANVQHYLESIAAAPSAHNADEVKP